MTSAEIEAFGGQADGLEDGGGLVDGLLVFLFGDGVVNDAGAGLDGEAAALELERTDGDGQIHVAGVGEVAHRAAVDAAGTVLQLVDQLHRADFRRAAESAGGEGRAEQVKGVVALGKQRMDVAHQVHHVGIALDVHEVLDVDAAGHGRAAQVVAAQVHQHEVFGALLRLGEEFIGVGTVLGRRGTAAARTGDGANGATPLLQTHQRLGRGTDEHEVTVAEEEGVGRGVHRAKGAVEL